MPTPQVSAALPLPDPDSDTVPLVSKLEPTIVSTKPDVGPVEGLSDVMDGAAYENALLTCADCVEASPYDSAKVTSLMARLVPVPTGT